MVAVNALVIAAAVCGFFVVMAVVEQVALRFGWLDYDPPEDDPS